MDWESKFSSIVRETESNLAKVKNRLGSAKTSSTAALHFNGTSQGIQSCSTDEDKSYFHHIAASTPIPNHSTQAWPLTSSSQMSKATHNASQALPVTSYQPGGFSTNPALHLGAGGLGSTGMSLSLPGLDHSEGVATVLQDRIDTQNKTLESMNRTMQRLEEERNLYYKQVKDLRDEMTLLNSRVAEKGVDIGTERKVDNWKREVTAELALLRNQMQFYRNKDEEFGMQGAAQSSALLKEMHDVRKYVQEECTAIRKEMEILKGRLVRVELEVQGVATDNRDTNRRQDRITKEGSEENWPVADTDMQDVQSMLDNQLVASREKDLNLTLTGGAQTEIHHLRSSYRSLRDKLTNLETEIQQNKRPKRRPRKLRQSPGPSNLLSPYGSDLDLDLSSGSDLPEVTLDADIKFTQPTSELTDDLLDTANTEGLALGTLDSLDYKLDSIDLTGDDLSDTDGEGLSLDELKVI